MTEHFDVIIVGAGIAGVSAAYHLQKHCPGKTFIILEARDNIGGTWDLFRYPGIRSDSDMYTLGFRWKPWRSPKAIADGPSILSYVREAAREAGVESKVRFGQRLRGASWSSEQAQWTLSVSSEHSGDTVDIGDTGETGARYTCNFLWTCTGYYRYASGYDPYFEGQESFPGPIVHPQHWPQELDYSGKRLIVIGSGATAMTLVPELARAAAHVVMLQRSPTYVISEPSRDAVAAALHRHLPTSAAYAICRWKNILLSALFFEYARRAPRRTKQLLVDEVKNALGASVDVDKHFSPDYNVWDQRVCLIPDGDLFEALRAGRAEVVTDQIERFTKRGIRLRSGAEVEADIIVKATGLELELLGGCELSVDGRRFDLSESVSYSGCMFTGLPNLANTCGYPNASWTLKVDLTSEHVCRMLQTMSKRGADRCVAREPDLELRRFPFLEFSSGYVQRAQARFPKVVKQRPFDLYLFYFLDLLALRYAPIANGVLELSKAPGKRPEGREQRVRQRSAPALSAVHHRTRTLRAGRVSTTAPTSTSQLRARG